MEKIINNATEKIDDFETVYDLVNFLSNNYKQFQNTPRPQNHDLLSKVRSFLMQYTPFRTSTEEFGTFRTQWDIYSTQAGGRYSPYRLKAIKLLQSGKSGTVTKVHGKGLFGKPQTTRMHVMTSNINGEAVELTTTNLCQGHIQWTHTNPDNIGKVGQHINNLYTELMQIRKGMLRGKVQRNEETLGRITRLASEIHWYFAQAMPCKRGSAGIGDMLKNVFFDSFGVRVPCWSRGKAPDLEALTRTLDDYMQAYPRLFEHRISWL